ncbi:MAG: hypothetical protein HY711_09625, partial [Candidatus Melainabacteria bacterium]|nr:hypothetical protein [Candidatus Melainabacteria bacterium]
MGMSAVKLFLPALGGWFFLYLLALFLFVRPLLLLGDGGSCRHFLNGVYFFEHWHIPTTNYMSSLSPNAPAVTRCLIGDLVSGGAYLLWHLNGVVLLAALALALALTWSYQFARARGLGVLSGLLLLVVATMASSMHWSA